MPEKIHIVVDPAFIQDLQKQFDFTVKELKKTAELLKQEQQRARSLELLNIEETAAYLKIVPSQLEYYEKHGLPYYRPCHKGKFYRRGEIDEWLESGAVNRHKKTRRNPTLF